MAKKKSKGNGERNNVYKLKNWLICRSICTRWKEEGLDMKAIQYLAGHVEGSEITDKVYIDISEEFAFEQVVKVL